MEQHRSQFRTDYRPILVTTKEQIDTMVQFMEDPKHFGLALNLITDVVKRQTLWNELVEILNKLGPPVRNMYRWRKVWNDLKSRSRNKYIAQNEHLLNPETARAPRLTILDERMIKVLGLSKQPNELILKYNLQKANEQNESNFTQNIVIKKEKEEYMADNYEPPNEAENDDQTITIEEALDILGSVEDEDCDNEDHDIDGENNDVESFLNSPENTNVLDSLFNVQDDEFNLEFNGNRINRSNNISVARRRPFIDDSDSEDIAKKRRRTDGYRKFSYTNQSTYMPTKSIEQPNYNSNINMNSKSKSHNPMTLTKTNSEPTKFNHYRNKVSTSSSMPMTNSFAGTSSNLNENRPEPARMNPLASFKSCRHDHNRRNTETFHAAVQQKLLSALNETNLSLKLFNKNLEKLLILKKYDMNQRNELESQKLELYKRELSIKHKANSIEMAKIVFNKKMNFFNK